MCAVARRSTLATVLLAVLAMTGCASQGSASQSPVANVSSHDADGLHGIVLPQPHHVPEARLADTSGRPFRLATDAKKPLTLVFFGYTNCPDICQVVMAGIASALVRLDDGQRAQVAMVFVTTDPARDTTRRLRSYLDRFNPSFEGATGDLDAIVRVAHAFDVPIEKGERLPSGGYDVNHGTQVTGVLPDGRAPFVWTQGTAPGELADDIAKILDDDKVPGL